MNIYDNQDYCKDISFVTRLALPWDKLRNSSILISGASGLVGSCLIDVFMQKNIEEALNCKIYALGRSIERAKERFNKYWETSFFEFISHDINAPLVAKNINDVDFVVHMASNTHPLAYATDPIGTIETNIIGLKNMLDFAVSHDARRFVFVSSNEIYGENRGDVEFFHEDYCGYINSNTMRAGYPESKRCGEALCQAYAKQKKLDIVIPRLTRSYGPTMLMTDTKAISQFMKKALLKENIILKSDGKQHYSFTYVMDAVAGLLTVLLRGKAGEAYNIADESGDCTLRELANIIANHVGTKVVFELPDVIEQSGYSVATKARLSGDKLKKLGWTANYDIKTGIQRTLTILNSLNK